MTVLDAGIIAVVAFFVAWGIWVGFVRQLVLVIALVVAFAVAGSFAGELLELLEPFVAPSRLTFFLSYLLLAGVSYLAVRVLAFALRGVATFALTPWFDRASGGVFGLAKAYLLLVLFYFVFSGGASPVKPLLEASYFRPHLATGAQVLQNLVRDEELREIFLPREPAISAVMPIPGEPPR